MSASSHAMQMTFDRKLCQSKWATAVIGINTYGRQRPNESEMLPFIGNYSHALAILCFEGKGL